MDINETTPEAPETTAVPLLKRRNVRIALAATAVAGVAFVVYKTKQTQLVEEAAEAVAETVA